MRISPLRLMAAFSLSLVFSACSDPGDSTKPDTSAYHGVWVSEDQPGTLWVLELLSYDPYLPVLAGKRSVYRAWRIPDGGEPACIQYGVFGIRDDGIELTPHRTTVADTIYHQYFNRLYDVDLAAGTMGFEAYGFPDDRRNLVRVTAFPGGSWTEGLPPHGDLTEPSARSPLVEDPAKTLDVYHGALFRTGEDQAVAVRSATFYPDMLSFTTTSDAHLSRDRGRTWVQDTTSGVGNYGSSLAIFKDQAHGRPLVYPQDSMSEYLFLWNHALGGWEKDIDIQICRPAAGFPDQDLVLTAWHALAYTLCIADPEVVYVHRRRLDLNSFRIQYLQGPVVQVRAQWRHDEGPRGTLYGLVRTGGQAPALRLYRHQEDDALEFGPEQLASPVAELAADCGALACEITEIWKYFISGGEHHILVLASFDGPPPPHPLAPEPRLAVHYHGTPEDGFTAEVLNVATNDDGPVYLGDLADFDLPADGQGWTFDPFVVLQDRACVRVLRRTAAGAWEDAGVVPTAHRPDPGATILWGDRLGLISAAPELDYLEFPLSSDAARCPAPRPLP